MKPGVEVTTLVLAKEDEGGRRLAGERERKRLLAAFDASGLTQRAFARQEGVNYFTFAGWLRRRRLEAGGAVVAREKAAAGFVELKLPKAGFAFELVLPDGIIVRASCADDALALVKGLR